MVNNRPTVRNLSVRKRWQGKNAKERQDEHKFSKFGIAFVTTAGMLGCHPCGMIFRILGIIMFYKAWKISQWDNIRADRIPINDLTIEGCTEETCYSEFRFRKRDLRSLFIALRFPAILKLDNGSIIPGEKAFLFFLHRMAFPRRLVDEENIFGREYSTASRTFKAVIKFLDHEHSHLLQDNLEYFLPKFPEYNRAILEKISVANNGIIPERERQTAFFLDGTKREICRPAGNDNIQRAVFDGRKKRHNLGFQGTYIFE